MRLIVYVLLLVNSAVLFAQDTNKVDDLLKDITASAYILIEAQNDRILLEKNATKRYPPASLTKVMTAYVVAKEIGEGRLKLTDKTTVSHAAWAKNFPGSSKMFIEVDKRVSIDDLLKGLMIQSGNDASVALAEHTYGTLEGFVQAMNKTAQELGLKNTHFLNPHGLGQDNHYSTVHDLGYLTLRMLRDYPEIYAYYKEKSFTYNKIKQNNRNTLLWDPDLNVDGVKTGYIEEVGYNLIASAVNEDIRFIAVVVGSKNEKARAEDAKKLLAYGFANYGMQNIFYANESIKTLPVLMGKEELQIGFSKPIFLFMLTLDVKNLEIQITLDDNLVAPIAVSQKVGTAIFSLRDEILLKMPVVALNHVEKSSFFKKSKDYLLYQFEKLF